MRGRLPETVRLRRDKPIFDRAVARRFCEYEWEKMQPILENSPQIVDRGYVRSEWLTSDSSASRKTTHRPISISRTLSRAMAPTFRSKQMTLDKSSDRTNIHIVDPCEW